LADLSVDELQQTHAYIMRKWLNGVCLVPYSVQNLVIGVCFCVFFTANVFCVSSHLIRRNIRFSHLFWLIPLVPD
jgi:hypothetical protein